MNPLSFLQRVGTTVGSYLDPEKARNIPSDLAQFVQSQAVPTIGRTIRGLVSGREQPLDMSRVISPLPDNVSSPQSVDQVLSPLLQATPTSVPSLRGRNPETSGVPISPEVDSAITQAALRYGLPVSLLYDIAFGESKFNPGAVGPTQDYGLFQFQQPTWDLAKNYRDKQGSTLDMPNEDMFDPQTAALVAAYLISKGQLSHWNASKSGWGKNYSPEELEPYYVQSRGQTGGDFYGT